MQKLFLWFFVILPFVSIGQTTQEVSAEHQAAEKLLLQHYPNAQKVDLEKLQREQKDLHKTSSCATCNKNKTKTAKNITRAVAPTITELRAEAEVLKHKIELLGEAQTVDQPTLVKYMRAYQSVTDKIDYLEAKSK
jgi:formate dehydrogenase assembly factor FdhD